jgi:HEPN domain-containing protein
MREHELWLMYAEYDLAIAKVALRGEYIAIPTALSLCQQAAEKAIKAYLIYKKHHFIKTHKIDFLVERCLLFDQEFKKLMDDAEDLSPHVTISRYPDSVFGIPDLETALFMLSKAENIVTFVKLKLPFSTLSLL